jgi:hypothetical protein
MKKFLSMVALSTMLLYLAACDEDDETFDLPLIQVVSANLEQRAGEAIDVTASVVADGGIKTI